jgi:hypothetical protein
MQLISRSDTAGSATNAESTDSEYVGKHRPSRLSLRHSRIKVSRLTGRETASQAK